MARTVSERALGIGLGGPLRRDNPCIARPVRQPADLGRAVHRVGDCLRLCRIEPKVWIAIEMRLPMDSLRRRQGIERELQRGREITRQLVAHCAERRRIGADRQTKGQRPSAAAHIEGKLVERRALKGRVPDLDHAMLGERPVGVAHLDQHVRVSAGLSAPGHRDRRDIANEHRRFVDLAQNGGDDIGRAGHPLGVRGQARPIGFLEVRGEDGDRLVERIADHLARHAPVEIALITCSVAGNASMLQQTRKSITRKVLSRLKPAQSISWPGETSSGAASFSTTVIVGFRRPRSISLT